jgi:hypothetical protein
MLGIGARWVAQNAWSTRMLPKRSVAHRSVIPVARVHAAAARRQLSGGGSEVKEHPMMYSPRAQRFVPLSTKQVGMVEARTHAGRQAGTHAHKHARARTHTQTCTHTCGPLWPEQRVNKAEPGDSRAAVPSQVAGAVWNRTVQPYSMDVMPMFAPVCVCVCVCVCVRVCACVVCKDPDRNRLMKAE